MRLTSPGSRATVGAMRTIRTVVALSACLLGWLTVGSVTAGAQGLGPDLALGRPATASSVEAPRPEAGGACVTYAVCAPDNANDGKSDTRWGSEYQEGQWWQVDLGGLRTINRVALTWHRAHPEEYLIQTSLDGQSFTTAAAVTVPLSEEQLRALSESRRLPWSTTFPERPARYVRILSVKRSIVLFRNGNETEYRRAYFGVSLWEASVFGPREFESVPQGSAFSGPGAPGGTLPTTSGRLRMMSPFPMVRLRGVLTRRGASIDLMAVRAPRAATIRVVCRGRGCPLSLRVRRGPARRIRELQRSLPAGTVIEVFVTRPGRYGKYTRFVIRRGTPPRRVDRCALAGSARPVACPV